MHGDVPFANTRDELKRNQCLKKKKAGSIWTSVRSRWAAKPASRAAAAAKLGFPTGGASRIMKRREAAASPIKTRIAVAVQTSGPAYFPVGCGE